MNDVAWGYQDNLPKTREERVSEFNDIAHEKFNDKAQERFLFWDMFSEEVIELKEAYYTYVRDPSSENRQELAKEWADAQVTLSNIAWYFNLNGEKAFSRVHENNMTKVVEGKLVYSTKGKIMKPEGYQPPDMRGI